jgi:hypothetical protein
VGVPALRSPGSSLCDIGQPVALQNDHLPKKGRQRAARRQSADTGSDDNGAPTNLLAHVRPLLKESGQSKASVLRADFSGQEIGYDHNNRGLSRMLASCCGAV